MNVTNGSTPIVIEPLTKKLLAQALQLDAACFGGLWSTAGYEREIDSPNSQLLILKRLSGSDLGPSEPLLGLGCVWFIVEEAHITLLAVMPGFRRQGLGMLLLTALLDSAIKYGSKWATLEVRSSNIHAQTLYQRIGFEVIGERKRYYQDTGENALIFWHNGLQEASFHAKMRTFKQETQKRLKQSGWMVQVPR